MTPDVVGVQVMPDHRLLVEFADGERRSFDMKPYLVYPAFSALADPGLFAQARAAFGTVVWNEEIDISPDTLYLRGQPVRQVA